MDTPVRAFMYENGSGGTSLGCASRIPVDPNTEEIDKTDRNETKRNEMRASNYQARVVRTTTTKTQGKQGTC